METDLYVDGRQTIHADTRLSLFHNAVVASHSYVAAEFLSGSL